MKTRKMLASRKAPDAARITYDIYAYMYVCLYLCANLYMHVYMCVRINIYMYYYFSMYSLIQDNIWKLSSLFCI